MGKSVVQSIVGLKRKINVSFDRLITAGNLALFFSLEQKVGTGLFEQGGCSLFGHLLTSLQCFISIPGLNKSSFSKRTVKRSVAVDQFDRGDQSRFLPRKAHSTECL